MLKFKNSYSIRATEISISVMYKAQMILIRDMLFEHLTPEEVDQLDLVTLEMSTVDGFQGRQNKIILLSWVVGGVSQKDPVVSAFFKDAHRLCVATSRAQYGFLMAGNCRGVRAAVDPKNFIRQSTKPPKLFDLLQMIKQENDIFCYPESEYLDNAPQRLQQEEERRGEQLEGDLLYCCRCPERAESQQMPPQPEFWRQQALTWGPARWQGSRWPVDEAPLRRGWLWLWTLGGGAEVHG